MRPLSHVAASGVISVLVWLYFRSFGCAVVSFAAGVLIDLDHLFDYYTSHRFTFSVKRIYCACVRIRFKKIYILLHSYELITALWAAIFVFSLSNYWKAVAIGFTQHLILDQLTNPISRLGYLLTYRIAKGFKKDLLIHNYLKADNTQKERLKCQP